MVLTTLEKVGIGALVVGGIAYLVMKPAATAAAATPTPTPAAPAAVVAGHWYVFTVSAPTGATPALVQAGLGAPPYSFTHISVAANPNVPTQFFVTAQASVAETIPLSMGGATITTIADSVDTSGNIIVPIPPTSYTPLTVGDWYNLSIRTKTDEGVVLTSANVQALLAAAGGWDPASFVIVQSTRPGVWNAIAKAAATSGSMTTSQTTDNPPLWWYIPAVGSTAGSAGPMHVGPTQPPAPTNA